jgi:hypothetical protein
MASEWRTGSRRDSLAAEVSQAAPLLWFDQALVEPSAIDVPRWRGDVPSALPRKAVMTRVQATFGLGPTPDHTGFGLLSLIAGAA